MNIYSFATLFVVVGVTVWIAGSILRRFERKAAGEEAPSESTGRLAVTLYGLTCLFATGTYMYVVLLGSERLPSEAAFQEAAQQAITAAGSITDDPVLRFLVYAVLGAIALCLILGVLGQLLYLLGFLLALAFFFALVVMPLVALAHVSPVGAVVAAILGSLPIIWFVRRYGETIAQLAARIFEPVYGMFFDWWLTPILLRQKEERLMKDSRKKEERSRHALDKLDPPDVPAGVPSPPVSPARNWIEGVAERIRLRNQQKTNAERIKLTSQTKQYFAETRGAINEYKGILEAKEDLDYVLDGGSRAEKEEEADIRRLDRAKRTLSLKKDIQDLKKKPEPETNEYRQKQEDKKAKRKVDVADNLFEQLEIPSITRVEGQKLYDRRRLEIIDDKALSAPAKADELKRLEKDFRQWLKKHNFSIFEDED